MAIHLTVVGFGKEPESEAEHLLNYCGFDPVSEGKVISASVEHYQVKTKVDGVFVRHITIHDVNIESPNLSLIFNRPFAENVDPDFQEEVAVKMGYLLSETSLRCGGYELMREVEGMFEDGKGNYAYVFKNVSSAIEEDLANCRRNAMIEDNKSNKGEG